jgi:hypothetical protein
MNWRETECRAAVKHMRGQILLASSSTWTFWMTWMYVDGQDNLKKTRVFNGLSWARYGPTWNHFPATLVCPALHRKQGSSPQLLCIKPPGLCLGASRHQNISFNPLHDFDSAVDLSLYHYICQHICEPPD